MDYYELLDVEKDATPEEIKKAFRQKSKTAHPDHGGDEEEFARLSEAYKTLSDEDKRHFYDQTGIAKGQSMDLHAEAENFLIQLFDSAIENSGCINGTDILDEIYKECRSRIHAREKDIQFVTRTKEDFEGKLGCIQKDGEDETIFDFVLKEKIQRCDNEIALAEIDIQTIEIALTMLKDYHPNPKEKDFRSRPTENKQINAYANFLLDNDIDSPLSSFAYGRKGNDDE